MREKILRFFIWSMVWVLAGTSVAFAQGSKTRSVIQYVPSALAKDAKDIPWVVNPKLPLHSERFIIKSNGVSSHAEAIRKYNAKKSASKSSRALPGAERQVPPGFVGQNRGPLVLSHTVNPRTEGVADSGTNLTGVQALKTLRPGWHSELLLAGFNEREVLAIEETFAETDELLFELDEEGNWLSPLGNDWEYAVRFSQILTDKLALNEGQVKTLFGKFSRLDDVFTQLNLQAFRLVHKRAPKTNAPGAEGQLARKVKYNLNKRDGRKMNPEVEGYVYGDREVVVAQGTPVRLGTPAPSYGSRGRAQNRTPEQVYEELLQFMREHNGEIPKREAADEYERKLRNAWDRIYQRKQGSNDPYVKRLIKLHDEKIRPKADAKTPQEILDYTQQYMREHNGKLPSQYSTDEVEKSNRVALDKFHQKYKDLTDEQVEALPEPARTLEKLFRQEVKQFKTSQEILDYMLAYMPDHNGKLPPQDSKDEVAKSNRRALNNFHQKYKNLTDEQVEELPEPERTLEKLFRQNVKQIAEAKTPQEILDYMLAYMPEHNGKLPSQYSTDEVAKLNRVALNNFHQKYKDLTDEQVEALPEPDRALEKLFRQEVKQYADAKTPQEILDYMLAYMPEHNGKLPSRDSKDPVAKSNRKALDNFHQKYKGLTDEQVEALPEPERTLEKLFRTNVRTYNRNDAE